MREWINLTGQVSNVFASGTLGPAADVAGVSDGLTLRSGKEFEPL